MEVAIVDRTAFEAERKELREVIFILDNWALWVSDRGK